MALFGKKTPKPVPVPASTEVEVPEVDPSLLRKNGIVLLSIDERWTALFSGRTLPPALSALESEMDGLLRRQAALHQELEQLEPGKKRAMQQIMKLTKEAFEDGNLEAKKTLQQSRDEIERINLRWSALLEETESVDASLRTANLTMMKVTASHVFSTLRQAQSRLPVLVEEIAGMEAELERKKVERDSMALDWSALSEPFTRLYGMEYVQMLETQFAQDIHESIKLLQSLQLPVPPENQADSEPTEEGKKGGNP